MGNKHVETKVFHGRMRELSKQLTAEFRTLSDTILELGNCFHLLYKAAVYFDNETALGQVRSHHASNLLDYY